MVGDLFVEVATEETPPQVAWLRAIDTTVQWRERRYAPLSDDEWFETAWTVSTDHVTITLHDAAPYCTSVEALTQQLLLAKDGRERTGTAARVAEDYAELGYTYVALDLDWPRDSLSGDMCCPDAIHVTIGYLPRMSPGEQAQLRRRLSQCLAAWL